jgi:glucose/arabinose dehydrogenase
MARLNFGGLTALLATLFLLLTSVAAQNCMAATGRFKPKMASGFKSSVIASGLRTPRGIAQDSEGNLLIAEQAGGSIRRLVLKENGDEVCVVSSTTLVSGGTVSGNLTCDCSILKMKRGLTCSQTNHGVDLSADGKTLFVSNLQSVTAYPYDAAAGTVGAGKVVVSGLGNNGPHPTRTILTSKNSPDYLLVARGSNANVDTQTAQQTAGRCMIKQFKISEIMSAPQAYNSGGEVTGWGLRNIVGMGENPVTGGIWSVENSMDDLRLNSKDVHNENPAERFNFHGELNNTGNKLKGANFGYPGCVAAWNIDGKTPGELFQPDNSPKTSDCAQRTPARIIMPPHTAPLDVKWVAVSFIFPSVPSQKREKKKNPPTVTDPDTKDGSAAYITFHGSWNRNPPDGYRLMKVEFGADGQPKHDAKSKTAMIPIMENPSTASCPTSCFRPVGLVIDKKKRIFMTSDSSGELYAIYGA